ncbi:uncharacterized protein LOC119165552 isoform X2 [Rhipicephalus microplus]|uniref:uncharacterized protein LOC119165552 isoform X2 n=1 Tax=Rhipicephalus microplus TaxID=6941 RepID=UPI003F6D2362
MQTEVLAAVFVLIATDIILYTAGRDVTEFLDQRQPIWTLKSTRRGNIRCEVDQIETAAPLSVSIKRCIVLERRRCEGRILGVLDAERQEQMTVFYRDIFARTETMLFMALDRSCAIFKVQSLQNWHDVYYDLRVRNASIQARTHPACKAFFHRFLGNQRPITVYSRHCQQLLRQRT